MAGIKPVPEGVGVAWLAASLSPGAGSAFEAFGQRRGTRQPRVNLRRNVRDSCEHGKGAEAVGSWQKAVRRKGWKGFRTQRTRRRPGKSIIAQMF
jgi:hypothetical protein